MPCRPQGAPFLRTNIVYGTDINGKIQAKVMADMSLSDSLKPIFIIADIFNRFVFQSHGCRVTFSMYVGYFLEF